MIRLWSRLPVLVRALVAGIAVLTIAGSPWQVLLALNLERTPRVPWSLPAGVGWLALVCFWLRGGGPPTSTRNERRASLRAEHVPASSWRALLAIGSFGWCGLLLLEVAFLRAFGGPPSAPLPPELPLVSVVAFALLASVGAGVVEECAFRGELQSPLESRYGPGAAIAISSGAFLLAHWSSAAGDLFLLNAWFYLGAGALFGFIAWNSGSILPGIVLHVFADLIGIALAMWSATSKVDSLAALSAGLLPAGLVCVAVSFELARRRVRNSLAAGGRAG